MTMITDAQLMGGSGLPLGSTLMLPASYPVDYTDPDGNRFLRCGFLETDIAALDDNLKMAGHYWESCDPVPSNNTNLRFIGASLNGTLICVYNYHQVYRSTDHGDTWTLVDTAPENIEGSIATDNNGRWFMSQDHSSQLRFSDDDGLTWSNKSIGASGSRYNYVMYGGNGRWAAISLDDDVAYSTDNGDTWTQILSDVNIGNNLFIASDGTLFARYNSGSTTLLRYSTNDGGNWQTIKSDNTSRNVPSFFMESPEYGVMFTSDEDSLGGTHQITFYTLDDDYNLVALAEYDYTHEMFVPGAPALIEFDGLYYAHSFATRTGLDFAPTGRVQIEARSDSYLFNSGAFSASKQLIRSPRTVGNAHSYAEGSLVQYMMIHRS